MVEKIPPKSEVRKPKKRIGLAVFLSISCIVVIGLAIAIIAIAINNNTNTASVDEEGVTITDEENAPECNEDENGECSCKNEIDEDALNAYLQEIDSKISSLGDRSVRAVIDLYEQELKDIEDPHMKSVLLINMIGKVVDLDIDRQFGEEIISYAVQADELYQTEETIITVINTAYGYGNKEVAEEYQGILNETTENENSTEEETKG